MNTIQWDDETETGTSYTTETITKDGVLAGDLTGQIQGNIPKETAEMLLSETEDLPVFIYVDICGAVASPGVYELPENSRVYEVIEMAGGLLDSADDTVVNRAEVLTDGSKIRILTKEEVKEQKANNSESSLVKDEVTGSGDSGKQSGKVNINIASESELTTLPGIGQSRASDIIQYRNEHGRFSSAEEIMKVPGIKEGTYQKLQDKITIE